MAGSLIKIDEEIVTSAVASVTLGGTDWDSSYDVYMVTMTGVTPDVDKALAMRVLASGVEQSTSNYDRAYKVMRADTTFQNASSTNSNLGFISSGLSVGTDTNEEFETTQYLFNFNNSSEYSFVTNEAVFISSTAVAMSTTGGLVYTVAEAHNGVSYFFEGGTANIEAGTFTLYGLKK